MNKSETIGKLAAALALAQGMIKPAPMDSVNPFFKSRYASLPAIWESIREAFTKNGLSIVQWPITDANGKIGVRNILLHSSGEWIATDSEAMASPEKPGPQALGVIVTYLRRYSLAAMSGQVADQDDDGEGATVHGAEKPRTAASTQSQPAPASGGDAEIIKKKQKVLNAIGAKIWVKDDNGEIKPDWERIAKEKTERAQKLGFDYKVMTAKQADLLITVFNTILDEEKDDIPF